MRIREILMHLFWWKRIMISISSHSQVGVGTFCLNLSYSSIFDGQLFDQQHILGLPPLFRAIWTLSLTLALWIAYNIINRFLKHFISHEKVPLLRSCISCPQFTTIHHSRCSNCIHKRMIVNDCLLVAERSYDILCRFCFAAVSEGALQPIVALCGMKEHIALLAVMTLSLIVEHHANFSALLEVFFSFLHAVMWGFSGHISSEIYCTNQ